MIYNNKYVEEEYIDEGHFSSVYKVKKINTEEIYALKILSKTLPNIIKDASREIVLHQKLNHKNVVKFIEFFRDNENIYIILEFCEKKDLAICQSFSIKEIKNYMLQIIEGLEYIHSKNIVHGDLKLENIFLTHNDEIKIGDFGHSNYKNRYSNGGTTVYMSPEKLIYESIYTCDFSTDIWSLGVILYIMLFNEEPFSHDRAKIMNVEYSFPTKASEVEKDLLSNIFKFKPEERLTLLQIKNHQFFKDS